MAAGKARVPENQGRHRIQALYGATLTVVRKCPQGQLFLEFLHHSDGSDRVMTLSLHPGYALTTVGTFPMCDYSVSEQSLGDLDGVLSEPGFPVGEILVGTNLRSEPTSGIELYFADAQDDTVGPATTVTGLLKVSSNAKGYLWVQHSCWERVGHKRHLAA